MKQNREFQFVYKRGKSAHAHSLVLFYLPSAYDKKIGYTASKKVGNAVVRNRSKRRLRALFTEYSAQINSGQYVLVAKAAISKTSYESLKQEYKKVLTKAGVITHDKRSTS
ncbi:MAG: ribonuclease P protein component [Epsilonproteobacteria bacterium]|nr:MAG: ribonuclease P protein component [Campylobacterota bacterium]